MLGKRRNGPKSVLACNRCRVLKIKCINVALKDVQESSLSGPPPIPDIPCDACQSATAPCSYELTAYQSKRRVVDLDSPPPDGLSSPRPRFADDHHNTVYAAPLARMPVVNKAETATVPATAAAAPAGRALPQPAVKSPPVMFLPTDSHPDALDVFFHRLNAFFGIVDESDFYGTVVTRVRDCALVESDSRSPSLSADGPQASNAAPLPAVAMYADASLLLYSSVLAAGLLMCGEHGAAHAWLAVAEQCMVLARAGDVPLCTPPHCDTPEDNSKYHVLQAALVMSFIKGSLLAEAASSVVSLVQFAWDQRGAVKHVAPHVDAALVTDACTYLHLQVGAEDTDVPRVVASRTTDVATLLMDDIVTLSSSRAVLRLAKESLVLADTHHYVHVRSLRIAVRQLQAEVEVQRNGMTGRALSLTSPFLRVLKFEQPCLPMFMSLAVRMMLLLLRCKERPDLLTPLCMYVSSNLSMFPTFAAAMSLKRHAVLWGMLSERTQTHSVASEARSVATHDVAHTACITAHDGATALLALSPHAVLLTSPPNIIISNNNDIVANVSKPSPVVAVDALGASPLAALTTPMLDAYFSSQGRRDTAEAADDVDDVPFDEGYHGGSDGLDSTDDDIQLCGGDASLSANCAGYLTDDEQ